MPKSWKQIPAFAGLDFKVEIQVRTLSQHIWAAASHFLQYKKEADVPRDVARSIHRVAALLETVDLEFERTLDQRARYIKSRHATDAATTLDTDNLQLLLDKTLPPENKTVNEDYSELLTDLQAFNITTVEALNALIAKRIKEVLAYDAKRVSDFQNHKNLPDSVITRLKKGVFASHVGLARFILNMEFGDKWIEHKFQKLKKRKGWLVKPLPKPSRAN